MSSPAFQALQCTGTLSSTNITNKYIEITITWPLEFTDKTYAAAYSAWSTRSGSALVGTITQSGHRDLTVCGITAVISLLSGATMGDEVFVDAIAYGSETTTACPVDADPDR